MSPQEFLKESWKPIPGWEENYLISNFGNVKARKNSSSRFVLRKLNKNYGYFCLSLWDRKTKKGTNHAVHRLVALTFLGPKKDGQEVCHIDGNRENNHVLNLKYGTRTENNRDKIKHGTSGRAELNAQAKLSNKQVMVIKTLAEIGYRNTKIAKFFGVGTSLVSKIICGTSYASVAALEEG